MSNRVGLVAQITTDPKAPALIVAAGQVEVKDAEPIHVTTRLACVSSAVVSVVGGDGSIKCAVDSCASNGRIYITASAPCVVSWIAAGT